jgi:hypothetical protein
MQHHSESYQGSPGSMRYYITHGRHKRYHISVYIKSHPHSYMLLLLNHVFHSRKLKYVTDTPDLDALASCKHMLRYRVCSGWSTSITIPQAGHNHIMHYIRCVITRLSIARHRSGRSAAYKVFETLPCSPTCDARISSKKESRISQWVYKNTKIATLKR